MRTIPFVHEGLGNSSYVVDLGNQSAIVVDPDRTVDRYVETLAREKLTLRAVLETHLHADFVSGAHELAARTGATMLLPEEAHSKLPHTPLQGGQSLDLDGCKLEAIASPGHTPEHLSYVVTTASLPPLLFSGGSLIVGGAARTDLIAPGMTESLTRAQFNTLRSGFTKLPDATLLLPTHGGGSFCSTGAGDERTSTLGRERRDNQMLAFESEDEFVRWFPTTFPAVPDYFFRLRAVNQAGPRLRRDIPEPRPLRPEEFAGLRPGAVVVDARSKEEYSRRHVRGSFSNPFRDAFAVWLGWLVPADAGLLFVANGTPVERLVEEALLVGYERLLGWLEGGIEAWSASGGETATTELVDAPRARRYLVDGAASIDVREVDEYAAGHLEGAVHIPLGRLPESLERVPRGRPLVVYCGHGERASTGASLLEAAGFEDLVNLDGGTGAWQDAGFPLQR